jgi:catechol 2,3-dioxygenase-like lactoylglutathione lyase family enzyme
MDATDRSAPFPATDVNHVALRVRDLPTSRKFYVEMFGARVTAESETACFMSLPDGDFIALFPTDEPHIEHFCLTLPDYHADDVQRRLEVAGHAIIRREDRIFVRDPDGLLVQLSGPNV